MRETNGSVILLLMLPSLAACSEGLDPEVSFQHDRLCGGKVGKHLYGGETRLTAARGVIGRHTSDTVDSMLLAKWSIGPSDDGGNGTRVPVIIQ